MFAPTQLPPPPNPSNPILNQAPVLPFTPVTATPATVEQSWSTVVNQNNHLRNQGPVFAPTSRDRAGSMKRFRNGDGRAVNPPEQNTGARSRNVVTGTLDSISNSRRIKSPPANIFVWGLLSDTTRSDIVADLALSDIPIKETDVELKSKPEARMCSYRISIPMNCLQKALDPCIWPMGVKVREYVFFGKKRNQEDRQGRQEGERETGEQPVRQQQVQQQGILTSNRFDML